MGLNFWCLLLVLLYFFWSSECDQETRNNDVKSNDNIISLPSENHQDPHHHHHHHGSHDDHDLDRSTIQAQSLFINLNDIKKGFTKPIYFPKMKKPHKSPPFQHEQQLLGAPNSVPFSLKQLPNLLRLFSVPQGSPQAKSMESTLQMCDDFNPIKGEIRKCVTSFDSMLDFVRGIFGLDGFGHGFTFLTTTFYNDSNTAIFQNYTVLDDLREIPIPKMVACHLMEFPYAVYGCHSMVGDRRLFKMSLRGERGDIVETIVVCHLDTSEWEPEHISFKALGFGPGMGPVCHFFPDQTNFVWIPSSISV
uniref:BURP domain-containing protein n=2 Tax=Cannabis sativa TaxID=3483 RepID=A0A803QSQ8_CANSA